MSNRPNFEVVGARRDDYLIAGDHPIRTDGVTLLAGQVLARGAVLGRITASGKYVLSEAAAADGSQLPVAILAEAVDASGGDKKTVAYIAGDFNANQLTIGAGHTVASIRQGLFLRSIYLHEPLAAYAPPDAPSVGS